MSLLPAAWTCGIATPASAEAAANRLVFFRDSRRDVRLSVESFMARIIQRFTTSCQSQKFACAVDGQGKLTKETLFSSLGPRHRNGHWHFEFGEGGQRSFDCHLSIGECLGQLIKLQYQL